MNINGIVLRVIPFKEKDMMVSILTENKLLSFYARGTASLKSKNAPALNLYSYSSFSLNEGPQGGLSLKEAIIIDSFSNCLTNYNTLSVLSFITELTLKSLNEVDAKEAFPYFLKIEELLNNGFDPLTLLNIYFARVLCISGIGLDVDECVFCHQRSDIVGISFKDGGFTCRKCFEGSEAINLTPRFLNIYRYIFRVSSEKIGNVEFNKEENLTVLTKLVEYQYNLTSLLLKSYQLIKKI